VIRGAPIGKRFEHCSFENFDVTDQNREAYMACKRVAEEGEIGVLLRGKNGLGKTHLLVAMMKEFDRRNSFVPQKPSSREGMRSVPSATELMRAASDQHDTQDEIPSLAPDEIERLAHIEYWPMLDLTSELRSDIAQGSQATSTRCRECDLLVLDDFGAERATDFVLEELVRIVDWRYRAMKLTAVATNLDFKTIVTKYGSRAISRWFESCLVVGITGEDRRASTGPV
jgi:DNA replication protein DnaC